MQHALHQTAKDVDAALVTVNEALGKLNLELEKAPRYKRGTAWWDDRCAERQKLLGQRESLRNRRRDIVARN